MIRLGLISDTHWANKIPLLPYEAIESAFRHVDGILHAGDIESQDVLDNLSGIAPTQAVRGESDLFSLPEKRVLKFGDVNVGLIHGNRHPLVERYFRLQRQFGNLYAGGRHLLDSLPARFEGNNVDVIVFGHLHAPMTIERHGIHMINPGAVYTITKEMAQWQLLHERDAQRRELLEMHIKQSIAQSRWRIPRSTVGILEIYPDKTIKTQIVDLALAVCV